MSVSVVVVVVWPVDGVSTSVVVELVDMSGLVNVTSHVLSNLLIVYFTPAVSNFCEVFFAIYTFRESVNTPLVVIGGLIFVVDVPLKSLAGFSP